MAVTSEVGPDGTLAPTSSLSCSGTSPDAERLAGRPWRDPTDVSQSKVLLTPA